MKAILNLFEKPMFFVFSVFGLQIKFTTIAISCLFISLILLVLNIAYNKVPFITNLVDSILLTGYNLSKNHLDSDWSMIISFLGFYIGTLNFIGCFGFFAVNGSFPLSFIMSFSVFFLSFLTGLRKKGLHVFLDLVPSQLPTVMRLFVLPIELLSACIRPISIGARLFFNIAIGHFVKHIMETVAKNSGNMRFLFTLPVLIINLMDTFTGLLQAYLFMLFSTLLIKSFVNKEH